MFRKKIKKNPSDRKILKKIYDQYFEEYEKNKENREAPIFVSVDLESIAVQLKSEKDIIFGRLYYYIDHKFSYIKETATSQGTEKITVCLFRHCGMEEPDMVNFPLLASILAGMEEETDWRVRNAALSIIACGISIGTILISMK